MGGVDASTVTPSAAVSCAVVLPRRLAAAAVAAAALGATSVATTLTLAAVTVRLMSAGVMPFAAIAASFVLYAAWSNESTVASTLAVWVMAWR